VSTRLEAFREVSPRIAQLHGSNDVDAMFGDLPKASTPWPRAQQQKNRQTYDPKIVYNELVKPVDSDRGLVPVDPRHLQATQPHLVRAAVRHYMSDQFRTTGQTFADAHQVGNAHPFVYSRQRDDAENPDEIIWAGHHRAAAALLKGEPLMARRVEGGWGPER